MVTKIVDQMLLSSTFTSSDHRGDGLGAVDAKSTRGKRSQPPKDCTKPERAKLMNVQCFSLLFQSERPAPVLSESSAAAQPSCLHWSLVEYPRQDVFRTFQPVVDYLKQAI